MAEQRFDAGEDRLTWDFEKYGAGSGEIPEPTSDQITEFLMTLREIVPVHEEDGEVSIDIAKMNDAVQEGSDLEALLIDAIARLTSNSPSAEQIRALPFRPQRRFFGWLLGVMLSPEA
jgi:hypothetical protein